MSLGRLGRMAAPGVLEGVFAVNKPVGSSSAQVIRDCQAHFDSSSLFAPLLAREAAARAREPPGQQRRRSRLRRDLKVKMGHGGTLDPLASGVLILGLGRGTKALAGFLGCTKTYEAVVLFGASTDTYDRVGRLLQKKHYDEVTRDRVEHALAAFRGTFRQMPPLYSALKMEGKPLYEYAREGRPVPREIATREVCVSRLELVDWLEPGTHPHRWPADEANDTEKSLAASVWSLQSRQQAASDSQLQQPHAPMTPQQAEEETRALASYESLKRKADARVDELVYDSGSGTGPLGAGGSTPAKRRRTSSHAQHQQQPAPLMSGALGDLPASQASGAGGGGGGGQPGKKGGRGSNLIPPPPAPNTPPPWEGKGPPAAKIRMTVTSGFYVRSFCHDLGIKVGSAAMMAELCRSRQGDFVLGSDTCLELGDLDKGEAVWGPFVENALVKWNEKGAATTPTTGNNSNKNSNTSNNEQGDAETAEDDTAAPRPRSASPPRQRSSSPTLATTSKDADKSNEPPPREEAQAVPPAANETEDDEWQGFDDAPPSAMETKRK